MEPSSSFQTKALADVEDDHTTPDQLGDTAFEMVVPEFGSCSNDEVLTAGGSSTQPGSSQAKNTPNAQPGSGETLTSGLISDAASKQSKKQQRKQAGYEKSLSEADAKFLAELDLGSLDEAAIKSLVKQGTVCFKCKMRRPNYQNKADKVCKLCFMESMIHRFKMSLRTNLKIWKDDLNLICISGGSNSMALLDLMHESLFGTSTQTQRKMFFKVHVLYIDEGRAVFDWGEKEHQQNLELVC